MNILNSKNSPPPPNLYCTFRPGFLLFFSPVSLLQGDKKLLWENDVRIFTICTDRPLELFLGLDALLPTVAKYMKGRIYCRLKG